LSPLGVQAPTRDILSYISAISGMWTLGRALGPQGAAIA
jgi:hypothetical protein